MLRAFLFFALAGGFVVAAQAAGPLQRYARIEPHMGVEFEIVLYAGDAVLADRALACGMARIAALDKLLSDYDADSELSRLSETSHWAGKSAAEYVAAAVPVSDDLWAVLSQSQQLSRASGGAYDVTIGPLSKLWRRARRWKELPEAEALAVAKQAVDWRSLVLDEAKHAAQLQKPNMRLDLGGIAKGYAADQAVSAIVASGVACVLVRASGDIAAADAPPGERGWKVGIAPLDPDEAPTRFIELAHAAVSTSGDARQNLVVSGRRYSHILDPRSGEPVAGRSSVTVAARRGVVADALATAASVLGPAEAIKLIRRFEGVELLMVAEDEAGKQQVTESAGFGRVVPD